MTALCGACCAAEQVETRGAQLAATLGITTNAQPLSTNAVALSIRQAVKTEGYSIKWKRTLEPPPEMCFDVDIIDTNEHVVASGRIRERSSFENAKTALFDGLTLNSMMIDALREKYEVQRVAIGDLCLLEKTFDAAERRYTTVPVAVHFVRGGAAVSLYALRKDVDLWRIARDIDAILTGVVTGQDATRNVPKTAP